MVQSNKRFKSRYLRVLFHLLPRRTKRLLFLSALSGKVTGEKSLARPVLVNIQNEFDLCVDPFAIELPLAFHDKIWGKRPIDELVCPRRLEAFNTDRDLTRAARQIVSIMPCWLVYDQTSSIISDVRDLLAKRGVIFAD